jgi:hypothetical protein
MLEYNPDQYDFEVALGGREPESPISAAVKWDAAPGLSLTLSRQHNQEWGIELSAALDTKSRPPQALATSFSVKLGPNPPLTFQAGIDQSFWYDTLLFDSERSGILLLEATIDETKNSITIVMGNTIYDVWMDAVDVMVGLADLHLPNDGEQVQYRDRGGGTSSQLDSTQTTLS